MADRPVAAKIGLVGPPGSGKTTLFCALTGAEYARAAASAGRAVSGTVRVMDPRLARFHEAEGIHKRLVAPAVEIVDAPSIALEGPERAGNAGRLATVRECDGLLAVLRAYEGEDPLRQLEGVRGELLMADIDVMQKRIERLQADTRKALPNREELERELEVFRPLCEAVAAGDAEAFGRLSPEDQRRLRGFQFYSRKPLEALANVSEKDLDGPCALPSASLRLEMELAAMEPAEREPFMKEYGLDGLLLDSLPLRLYAALGFITFLTTNEKEVAGWALRRGATAHEAAGRIHTDLQKGFIGCDVVSFQEWSRWKNLHEAHARGRRRTEGRDYVVEDFDVLTVRFNV